MTPEILEGNKLILEFDGWTIEPGMEKHGNPFYNKGFAMVSVSQSEFYTSWDWLMPVVEKIEKMDYGFKMCRKVVEVYIDSTKEVIIKTKESCRLESLYTAVVQFIQWHSRQGGDREKRV